MVLISRLEGLEKAHFLLLCRRLHQLQFSCDRSLQDLQDEDLDVCNQSCIVCHTNLFVKRSTSFSVDRYAWGT